MDIKKRLRTNRLILLDGSMGALLLSKGIKPTELLNANIEHKDILCEIHTQYLEAGCDVVITNTFNITNETLAVIPYSCEEIVASAYECAKTAAIKYPNAAIALDLGPSGFFPDKNGDFPYEEAVALYSKQISAAPQADIVMLETTSVLQDVKAFAEAASKLTDKPAFASMTFTTKGKTWYGVSLDDWITEANSLPLAAAGINCTLTPQEMLPFAEKMMSELKIPVIAEPNMGNPVNKNGKTSYEMTNDEFAQGLKDLYDSGIKIIGGCCGSNPECIKKFRALL